MSKAAELAALIGSQTALSNRNLIINGAMQVAQRGTSGFAATGYTLDRFKIQADNMDNLVFEVSQSTTTPADFSNSLRVEVTTAETALASDELMYLFYGIEAQDLQHINYGSSDAKKLTLSFWVRSSLTGTYSLLAYHNDDVRASTHAYTVNTANTWEYKTITIPADTTGVIDNDNGTGLGLYWTLAAGSNFSGSGTEAWKAYVDATFADSNQVDFTAQTGNFYITGVQLEVGEQATPFEHRSIADELLRCKRYYNDIIPSGSVALAWHIAGNASVNRRLNFTYPEMRATPTADFTAVAVGSFGTGYPNLVNPSNRYTEVNMSLSGNSDSNYTYLTAMSLDAEL